MNSLQFGYRVCGVVRPRAVLERIAEAMHETLSDKVMRAYRLRC